jgi:subtilase family serine protease
VSDRYQLRRQVSVITLAVAAMTWVAVTPSGVGRPAQGIKPPVARAHPMAQFSPESLGQPQGFSPGQIIGLYGFPASKYAGVGQTIAIVDAYDNPGIGADLAAFDRRFGLRPCGSGCLTRVGQNGGASLPAPGPFSWELEIALDVEWAHALAPAANILLVEAASDQLPDLLAADSYAGEHASYVSNSWGSPEFASESSDDVNFMGSGVSYFAAAADAAGQIDYPATSPRVVSVGGDEHTAQGARDWPSSGGGCSAFEPAPLDEVRLSVQVGCGGRTMTPSASAVATGIPVFVVRSGWWRSNGNSFATVLWAAALADSGQTISPADLYAGKVPLRPIAGGNLMSTGMGDLDGPVPMTMLQGLNMLTATESASLAAFW